MTSLANPTLTALTGTWTLPFAVYAAVLSLRVVNSRLKSDHFIGDRSKEGSEPDTLQINARAHANFIENVPFALTLTTIAELNGANRKALNFALATLLVLRILHVEAGIKGKGYLGWGRKAGYLGTQGFLAGMAAYSTWLVKGYWAF